MTDQDTDQEFIQRACAITWLLLDVDGVLTDGRLWYTADGETLKPFHVRDGLAIKLAQASGIRVGLLTGRSSAPLRRRAQDLGLDVVIDGSKDKDADFTAFLASHEVDVEQVAFIGDDLIDLAVLRRCGLAMAPLDAAQEVQAVVSLVLEIPGGHGAVRLAVEKILGARGDWQRHVERLSETRRGVKNK